jgi:hypothetical protein
MSEEYRQVETASQPLFGAKCKIKCDVCGSLQEFWAITWDKLEELIATAGWTRWGPAAIDRCKNCQNKRPSLSLGRTRRVN